MERSPQIPSQETTSRKEGILRMVEKSIAFRESEEGRVDPNAFRDIYSEEKIDEDLGYVKGMKAKFKEGNSREEHESKESKRFADAFEILFQQGVNKYEWLGEKARVIKTSEVDDIRNGVDGIVEFGPESKASGHLAIGIDVTYSNQLSGKFKRIREDIDNGKLTTVEYFQSGNYRGELVNVPRVIVGADINNVLNMCQKMFRGDGKDAEKLRQEAFQILILEQMKFQLQAFAAYAVKVDKRELAKAYRADEEIVRGILRQKKLVENISLDDELKKDKVLQAIQKELEQFT